MCLTWTVTVLEVLPDAVRVLTDGRERLIPNLVVPDVAPGDRVVIGLGVVLGPAPAADHQIDPHPRAAARLRPQEGT